MRKNWSHYIGPTNLKVTSPTKIKSIKNTNVSLYIVTQLLWTSSHSLISLHFPLITNIFLLLKKDIGLEMESYLTKWCVVLVLLCFGFSVVKAQAQAQVPCFFVFGDSLVDNGNNNGLISIARSNYFPYGIDFGGPTGRFSNGKTTVDVIGMQSY